MIRVGWIFSLVRSGSSVTAYGCAAPWGLGVADEPFGPWDRTMPPYNLPPVQRDLVRAFAAMGHTLSAEVVGMANELFRILAERSGDDRVVCKCPHLLFDLDDFETWFGGQSRDVTHRCLGLIRNPLHRVNSAYARGWEHMLNDPFELEVFRTFLRRWQRMPNRFRFDDVMQNPAHTFLEIHKALGFGGSSEDAAASAKYVAGTYHDSSAETSGKRAARPISESRWAAPPEVTDVYLNDEEIASFMREQGWPTRRIAYLGSPFRTVFRTLTAT
ncbi:MAG: hypothetical protein AAF937_03025 [Planctomycetota bacterium]